MSSLTAKDRVSLCLFSFTDGRRCRTPRTGNHPHFCFYHAQKEAQAQAAVSLGKDLAYFFSGNYLSACDLSAAFSRLIPAVVRGEVKPRLARTVAYMMQTLMQTIHLSQDEYINAFGSDGWRKAVRYSVKSNHDHLFPPTPKPEELNSPSPVSSHPSQSPTPTSAPTLTPAPHSHGRPAPADAEAALSVARSIFPPRSDSPTPQPVAPQPAAAPQSTDPTTTPPRHHQPSATPNRDPYAVHFDHNYRLRIDGKPF